MAYLVKPFTKADLVPAIEMAVSRFAEIPPLDTEIGTLRERLEVRKLLDRAKGLLQSEHGLSEAEAFRWIQKTSIGPPPHHAQGGRSRHRGQHGRPRGNARSHSPEARGKARNPGGRWCRARLPRPTRCLLGPPGLAVTTLATSRPEVQKHAIAGPRFAALSSAADYSLFHSRGSVPLASSAGTRSLIRQVSRDVHTRRPAESEITMSYVAIVRPPCARVATAVTSPSRAPRLMRRADLDADHHPAQPGVQGRAQRSDGLREHAGTRPRAAGRTAGCFRPPASWPRPRSRMPTRS